MVSVCLTAMREHTTLNPAGANVVILVFPPKATCLLSIYQCLALSILKTILSKYDVLSKYEGYFFLVIGMLRLRLRPLNVIGRWGNITL